MPRVRSLVVATAFLLLSACHEPVSTPRVPEVDARVAVALEVSDTGAPRGARIALGVRVTAPEGLAGVQGVVRFDPARLRYVGQPASAWLVMVNDGDAARGELTVLSLEALGLPDRGATLVFEVLEPGYAPGLEYRLEIAATRRLGEVREASWTGVRLEPALAVPAVVRRLLLEDWYEILAPDLARAERRPQAVPGQYVLNLRYGDATLNGAINVLDAAAVANVAVGNLPLLTDATRDYVVAGNVHPANLPGLGEPGDALPPGRGATGAYELNVLDAAAVANETVGNDQPVVGELIPGRGPLPANRVIVAGNIDSSRTLFRDTIYELQDLVVVQGGATLTIEPGTRIEGDVATRGALVVARGGNIVAAGTRLEPIVFTCNAPAPSRGCWGGLAIHGFSLLNNGEQLPGGDEVNGCPQLVSPAGGGYFGGCIVEDTSGVLRYVRIEYAGAPTTTGGPVAGLSLLGIGTGTIVDSIQVHESLGDGLRLAGGTVDLRHVVLTDNAADGLVWSDGYVGRLQFVIVQQSADNDHAIHGINFPLNPNAGPRSSPVISHLTVVGPPAGQGAAGGGVLFEHGSSGRILNAIVLRAGTSGLDVDGPEAIAQAAGGALRVEHSIFFGSPEDFSGDADALDESGYALTAALANRVTDPGLLAPFNTLTPDLRHDASAPPNTGYVTPPVGFFDLTAAYVGAVAPANGPRSNAPWYAGWTRGF